MSTLFHEPITGGESKSPDTLNTRFGDLDAAIGANADALEALILSDGDSDAEVIAARTGLNYKSGTPPSTLAVSVGYAASDIYNVRAYGAVGNGSTDDTTAIQAALNAAGAAGGGIVFLPRGTYKITTPALATACLGLYDYVTLRGAGAKSIIDFRGSDGKSAIDLSGCTDACVENLQIQNLSAVSAEAAIQSSSLTVRMKVRSVIIRGSLMTAAITNIVAASGTMTVTAPSHGFSSGDDVYNYGTGTIGANTTLDRQIRGITVVNANTFTVPSTITNSATVGTAQKTAWFDGINIKGPDAVIEGCDIQVGFYSAIRFVETARRSKITHCYVALGFRGIMYDSLAGNGAAYCIAEMNHLENLKQAAGKIEDTSPHNIFCDNVIINCSSSAFADATFEIAGPYTAFQRNTFFYNITPLSTSAIDTVASDGHITIRGNTIKGHNGTVINLRSGAIDMEVTNNQIDGGNIGISLQGTNIFVVGNRVSNVVTQGIVVFPSSNFVLMNNLISHVTAGQGIKLDHSCNYGSVTGNVIVDCWTEGIFQGNNSGPGAPGKYVAMIGNVIVDVGNSGSGANIQISINTPKFAIVGNVCDDTPETFNIRGSGISSIVAIGNATQKGVNLTGTTVTSTNNI